MKVITVFKTHVDIGFTDLPLAVLSRYAGNMLANAIVTLGAALIGLFSGLLWRGFVRLETLSDRFRLFLTVCTSHFVGSVVVKTFGLAAFYSFPIEVLFLWRLLNYAIIGVAESVLLCLLFRNQFFRKQILYSSSVEGGYKNEL